MDTALAYQGSIAATYHGVRIPAGPHLGPGMIAALAEGRYERQEIRLALAQVPQGARILELGAGAGVAGAIVARHCAPAAMTSVEANPALIPQIRALYAENASPITLLHGAVFSDPAAPETVPFFVRGNFLGSGLTRAQKGQVREVQVPVIRYADLVAQHPHDVLLMDIEGAELEFLRHADLSGVSLLIGEFHPKIYGREGMKACRKLLVGHGFRMDAEGSALGVHVWRRAP